MVNNALKLFSLVCSAMLMLACTPNIEEDIKNAIVGTMYESTNENTIMEKDDRCTRLAKNKYDTWPSAYASGAVVRCRRGDIWKKK